MHEPPQGSLLRRNWVRLFMGSFSLARIISVSTRSLSFFRHLSSSDLLFFFFMQRFLQNVNYTNSPLI